MVPRLIICIDGLGKDLISQENTPFLHKFGKKNYFSELETLFAFTGIEYSFFTGKPPKETKIWLEFQKSQKSIFDNELLRMLSINKTLKNYAAAALQYIKGRTWISGLHNIPNNKLKYFDTCIKQNLWKLKFFKKRDFVFYKWPFFVTKEKDKEKIKIIFRYASDEKRLEKLLKPRKKEIYYTQLMSIDKTIHKFGKKSKETEKVLRKMDKLIEKYIIKFLKENKKGKVFIWSDHGFADIKNYIDLEKILPKREDYLYFIAGTTIHFWFENENVKKNVLEIISKIKEIKILDKRLMEMYKIPSDKKYGEVILFVEKGNYFFPNFYQRSEKEKFVSMHGYPDDKELNGMLISNKKISRADKSLKMDEIIKLLQ